MDERLRKLERGYRQGLFGKEETQHLQQLYLSTFNLCPSWFVIQRIKDSIQEYTAISYNNHLSVRESVDALLAEYASVGDPTVAQVLEEDRPYRLQVSFNVDEKIVNDLPMIIATVWLRIGFQWNSPAQRQKWEEIRNRDATWLRDMLAASLEQCGYYGCTSLDESRISDDLVVVTGVGYPFNLVGPSPILAEFREMYRTWIPSRGPANSVEIVMSVEIDTLNLKGRREFIRDSYGDTHLVIPGSLRHWLLEGNPGGTNRGPIYYGHLVLARVPNDMFLDWSNNRGKANQELTQAFEADIETLPEMIFFVDTQHPREKTIYIVPTRTDYFKACYYLPLVAADV
jgi:hypothetical protein